MEEIQEFIKTVTPIIATVVAIFGIIKYFDSKRQEFKKRIWEERKSLYYEITNYTSKIAIANTIDIIHDELKGFWSMYYGRLSIIEDANVYVAMINYGEELKKVEHDKLIPSQSNLKNLSFKLAIACRVSLQNTWEPVKLENLGKLHKTQKNQKNS
ncbi:hypothetical protein [Tenacibaculum agarivorans]|uniref:hypothetical protein n=1 Tax=Tenacibaculum agarivorans TaxID=1908389 RepID=UPI00094B9554|nr:hypothetical protein [Tenacibaculum agarivorans]